jgi:hypothetical protein
VALAVLFLALLFSPLYEQAFYWAGWEKTWPKEAFVDSNGQTIAANSRSGKHKFHTDVECIVRRVADGDAGKLRNLCFAQGPKPASGSTDLRDRLPISRTPTATAGP